MYIYVCALYLLCIWFQRNGEILTINFIFHYLISWNIFFNLKKSIFQEPTHAFKIYSKIYTVESN